MVAWPTDRAATSSPDGIAQALNGKIKSLNDQLTPWRASINTTGQIIASDARVNYQAIVDLRVSLIAWQGVSGLGAAIIERYAQGTSFDPVAAGTALASALLTFINSFQSIWPKTAAGNPSFDTYNGSNLLASYTVTLTSPQKTSTLSQLDAIIALLG